MVVIDYGAFPHIVERIVQYTDYATRVQLRRVCCDFQDMVEPLMFQSVIVTEETCCVVTGRPTQHCWMEFHGHAEHLWPCNLLMRAANGAKLPGPPFTPSSALWCQRLAHTQAIKYAANVPLRITQAKLLSTLCPKLLVFFRWSREKTGYNDEPAYAPAARNVIDKVVVPHAGRAVFVGGLLLNSTYRHTVHVPIDPHRPAVHNLSLFFVGKGAEELVLIFTGPRQGVTMAHYYEGDPKDGYGECNPWPVACQAYHHYQGNNPITLPHTFTRDCVVCRQPVPATCMGTSFLAPFFIEIAHGRYRRFTIVGLTDFPRTSLGMPATATDVQVNTKFLEHMAAQNAHYWNLATGPHAVAGFADITRFYSAAEYRDKVGKWWDKVTA